MPRDVSIFATAAPAQAHTGCRRKELKLRISYSQGTFPLSNTLQLHNKKILIQTKRARALTREDMMHHLSLASSGNAPPRGFFLIGLLSQQSLRASYSSISTASSSTSLFTLKGKSCLHCSWMISLQLRISLII